MAKKLSDNPVDAAWLDGIIHSLPLGVHLYELKEDQLIFTGANKTADEILGIHHSKLVGMPIQMAFPPLSDTEIPSQYKKVALTGKAFEAERVYYEDQEISGAFQVYAVQTAPRKIAVMFLDITKKKIAEEELRGNNEELRVLNEKLEMQNRELQQTYEKLKASEENFKQLADNIVDIFWLREGRKVNIPEFGL